MIKLVANQLRCLVPRAQHHVINLESMGNDGEEGKNRKWIGSVEAWNGVMAFSCGRAAAFNKRR